MSEMQVASNPDVMTTRLTKLAQRMFPAGGRVEGLRRLSGGSSQETWAFAIDGPIRREIVLRRAPNGIERPRAVAAGLAKEAQLLSRAQTAGVPVPQVLRVLDPEDGLGVGFLMARLSGETIARKILRDAEFDAVRPLLAHRCGAVLAKIHAIPVGDLQLRQSSAANEIQEYYRKYVDQNDPHPVFELAFRWLGDNLPPPIVSSLVHGDFRLGNLMIAPSGLCGVLDWELAHLGDPMEDVAYMCVPSWRFGNLDLPVGGFGRSDDYHRAYAEAGGLLDEARIRWWGIFGILKWGVMCGGMALTFRSGVDPSAERGIIGRRASETEIDLLRELTAADA